MAKPVPAYTDADVARVLARDYATALREARTVLASYGKETWQPEPIRVHMACLKLAAGNVAELEQYVQRACVDYRDVLAWAEYPAYMKADTPEARGEAMEADRRQLQEWLHRGK